MVHSVCDLKGRRYGLSARLAGESRSAGVPPAVAGASRSRELRGQDAHAPAGETPALRRLVGK